jgi:hypothetical protein
MDRAAAGSAIVALVAVATLAAGGATLGSTELTEGFGVGGGAIGDGGPGSGGSSTAAGGASGGGLGDGPGIGVDAGGWLDRPDASGDGGGDLPVVGLGVLAVLAGVGLFAVVRLLAGGPDDRDNPKAADRTGSDPEGDGRPAARVTSVDPENGVYRAWWAMIRGLDVSDPRARTPTEFAAAAADAGMSRGAVAALTDLFEGVRYGGREPTAAREARAAAALRRIEDGRRDGDGGSEGGIEAPGPGRPDGTTEGRTSEERMVEERDGRAEGQP